MDRDYGQYKLKELKKGEFFTLKDYGMWPDESKVYIRGEYDRADKKYDCWKFADVNHESFFNGDRKVFAGFVF